MTDEARCCLCLHAMPDLLHPHGCAAIMCRGCYTTWCNQSTGAGANLCPCCRQTVGPEEPVHIVQRRPDVPGKCSHCDEWVPHLEYHEADCGIRNVLRQLGATPGLDWSPMIHSLLGDASSHRLALRFLHNVWRRNLPLPWRRDANLRHLLLRLPVLMNVVRAWCRWVRNGEGGVGAETIIENIQPLMERPEAARILVVELEQCFRTVVTGMLEHGMRSPSERIHGVLRRWECQRPGWVTTLIGDRIRHHMDALAEGWLSLWLDIAHRTAWPSEWSPSELEKIAIATVDLGLQARFLGHLDAPLAILLWRRLHPTVLFEELLANLTYSTARLVCQAHSVDEIVEALLSYGKDAHWTTGALGSIAFALVDVHPDSFRGRPDVADWFLGFPLHRPMALPLSLVRATTLQPSWRLGDLRHVLINDFPLVLAHRGLGAHGHPWAESWLAYFAIYVRKGGTARSVWRERRPKGIDPHASQLVAAVLAIPPNDDDDLVAAAAHALLPTGRPSVDWALMRRIALHHPISVGMVHGLRACGAEILDDPSNATVLRKMIQADQARVRRWVSELGLESLNPARRHVLYELNLV